MLREFSGRRLPKRTTNVLTRDEISSRVLAASEGPICEHAFQVGCATGHIAGSQQLRGRAILDAWSERGTPNTTVFVLMLDTATVMHAHVHQPAWCARYNLQDAQRHPGMLMSLLVDGPP